MEFDGFACRLVGFEQMRPASFCQQEIIGGNGHDRLIGGVGTYPVIGSYDDIAELYAKMADAGLDGMAVGLVNYITEFPHLRDGVLPRMERLGLRQPRHPKI